MEREENKRLSRSTHKPHPEKEGSEDLLRLLAELRDSINDLKKDNKELKKETKNEITLLRKEISKREETWTKEVEEMKRFRIENSKEIKSIREQLQEYDEVQKGERDKNEKFQEDLKKEVNVINKKLKTKEEQWTNMQEKIDENISKLERKMEEKIRNIDKQMKIIEENDQKRNRIERRNNIIIKCREIEENKSDLTKTMKTIMTKMGIEIEHSPPSYIGKDWKERGIARLKLRTLDEKIRIMRSKFKLKGYDCYIEDDMTKREREIQAEIRVKAKIERRNGNEVKIGFQKIQINGEWISYSKENEESISKN